MDTPPQDPEPPENEKNNRLKRYRGMLAKLEESLKLTDEAIKLLEDLAQAKKDKNDTT